MVESTCNYPYMNTEISFPRILDSSIKQTLSSLSFLERVCKSQITRIAARSAAGDAVDGMVSALHVFIAGL